MSKAIILSSWWKRAHTQLVCRCKETVLYQVTNITFTLTTKTTQCSLLCWQLLQVSKNFIPAGQPQTTNLPICSNHKITLHNWLYVCLNIWILHIRQFLLKIKRFQNFVGSLDDGENSHTYQPSLSFGVCCPIAKETPSCNFFRHVPAFATFGINKRSLSGSVKPRLSETLEICWMISRIPFI